MVQAPASLSNPAFGNILLALAGVAAYLCIQSLLVWLSRRRDRAFLVFSGWAACSLLYVVGQWWQYKAPTPQSSLIGARLNVAAAFLIAAFVAECVSELTGRRHSRLFRAAAWTACITGAFCTLVLPGSVVAETNHIVYSPFGHTWYAPDNGPLFYLYFPVIITVLIVLFRDVLSTWRNRAPLDSWILLAALGVYTLSGLNDVLVSIGAYRGLTIFEYASVVMVVLVDFVLVRTHKRLHEEVETAHQTIDAQRRTDALTGLANRQEFERRAGEIVAHGLDTPGDVDSEALAEVAATAAGTIHDDTAVVSIDIARFKAFNDSAGHAYGDAVLRAVADRLGDLVDEHCRLVARSGGDEFMLLVAGDGDCDGQTAAERTIQKVFDGFAQPVDVDGEQRFLGFRAGYAVASATSEEDIRVLMKSADAALHHARLSRWNSVAQYTPGLVEDSIRAARIEADLRKALSEHQFFLVYQPKVRLATREIYGAEALIRWTHPELGLISPMDFIPVAEASGFMDLLGPWILREAFHQAAVWAVRSASRGEEPISVSVNISPVQLTREDFYDLVVDILDETGVDPHLIELEVTETAVMDNSKLAIDLLTRLRELGLQVSVDDFGTGYSSLSYLANLPFDAVKLDRDFIRALPGDPDAEFITHMVIALGDHKRVSVVAEGVETERQWDFLVAAGCDSGQGWLFGKPVLPEEFEFEPDVLPAVAQGLR
ncbi:MAG: EAL domain-containing protein [Acidimicrobiia bacterium]|nr:EAL domain-containing protein [Acidimicrobiia bacterium]